MNPAYEMFEKMPRHQHWDQFDVPQEGAMFNYLEFLTSHSVFDQESAELTAVDICKLIHSKGYADEDSFSNMLFHAEDQDSEYTQALIEQHDKDPDYEYTSAIHKSLRLLRETAITETAVEFVTILNSRFSQARQDGVLCYLDEQNEKIETNRQYNG